MVALGVKKGRLYLLDLINFAVKHILQEELTPVDTTVGWMKFDTCDLMKSQDPISWRIARDEHIDELASDEQIMSFDNGSTYYWVHDLEPLI